MSAQQSEQRGPARGPVPSAADAPVIHRPRRDTDAVLAEIDHVLSLPPTGALSYIDKMTAPLNLTAENEDRLARLLDR